MNSMLSTFLQNELVLLSTEAKKKGVENAAEKLLFIIKKINSVSIGSSTGAGVLLSTNGNTITDRSSQSPTTASNLVAELEKTSDTITPFMLSLETKHSKLVSISLGCIQKLISEKAIPQECLSTLLTHLYNESSGTLEIQFKILQILLPFCTNYSSVVHGNLLASCLLLCFKYSSDTNSPILSNTASATFRQLVLSVFERLELDDDGHVAATNDLSLAAPQSDQSFMPFYRRDGLALFKDLCNLTTGDPGVFLNASGMSKIMGLELIESVMVSNQGVFENNPALLALVRDTVCPLVIRLFSEKSEFPMMVRLVRTVKVVVKLFTTSLSMECEIFLTMFYKILQTSNYMEWQRILILECIKGILAEPGLQLKIFDIFDKSDHSVNVYADIVAAVSAILFDARNYLMYFQDNTSTASLPLPGTTEEVVALSIATASVKLPCLEQMEKTEAPSFPDAYTILLTWQCIISIVDQQFEFVSSIYSANHTPKESSVLLAKEMVKFTTSNILYALTIVLISSTDQQVFSKTCSAFSKCLYCLGITGLHSDRDAYLQIFCRLAITSQLPPGMESVPSIPKDFDPESLFLDSPVSQTSKHLASISDRNILLLASLISACQDLFEVLDAKTWFVALEAIASIEACLSKVTSRRADTTSELFNTKETSNRDNRLAKPLPYLEAYSKRASDHQQLQAHFVKINDGLFKLKSTQVDSKPFLEFVRAVCRVAHESLLLAPGALKEKHDEKNFAISKLHELCLVNIPRIVTADPEADFFGIVSHLLIDIAHLPVCPASTRAQVCTVLGDVILSASSHPVFSENPRIELGLINAIHTMMAFQEDLSMDGGNGDVEDGASSTLVKFPFLVDVRRNGLDIVNKLIQTSGQNIREGWLALLEIIYFIIQPSSNMINFPSKRVANPNQTQDKAVSIARLGFSSLQLICTDFMAMLTPMGLSRCIQTATAFGAYSDDVNISLTSIGLLWSLCDFILTKKKKMEKEEPKKDKDGPTSPNLTLEDLTTLSGPLSISKLDTLWMYLLTSLSELCSDPRREIRNSANQTLFQTISLNGNGLGLESWDLCLSHVLFPLLARIKKNSAALEPESTLWDETKILTLNGITKAFLDYFHVLVELDRFDSDWQVFLEFFSHLCLTSSQEVALATLKTFKLLLAYPASKDIPENVAKKLVALWRVCFDVWYEWGLDILKTNLVEVSERVEFFKWSDGTYPTLIAGRFSQDSLSLFTSIIFDLQPIIAAKFSDQDFQKVLRLMQKLVLYHSKSSSAATPSRIRADVVNDLDILTTCQSYFFDFLTSEIGFSHNLRSSIMLVLANTIYYPFIPFSQITTSDGTKTPIYNYPNLKKHSFIALSKKCYSAILGLMKPGDELVGFLKSGAFEAVMLAFRVPLSQKYSCPPTSPKDPELLYNTAILAVMELISNSIEVISKTSDIASYCNIYNCFIDTLDAFLLSGAPFSCTMEQFAIDEEIEFSVIDLIEGKVLQFLGNEEIPDCTMKVLTILRKIATYEYNAPPISMNFKSIDPSGTPRLIPTDSISTIPGLSIGPDQTSPVREKISNHCLKLLFRLAALLQPEKQGVATIALSILLETCNSLLRKFIADRPLSDRLPLPRNQEILLILEGLLDLKIKPNSVIVPQAKTTLSEALVKTYFENSEMAPLFKLYPLICSLLQVVSKFAANDTATGNRDSQMVALTLQCLTRIGTAFSNEVFVLPLTLLAVPPSPVEES